LHLKITQGEVRAAATEISTERFRQRAQKEEERTDLVRHLTTQSSADSVSAPLAPGNRPFIAVFVLLMEKYCKELTQLF
jgi:hypothetical protein